MIEICKFERGTEKKMRRKRILFVLLGAFAFILGACGDSNHIKESYGTFEYENTDGSIATITVDEEEITFQNVNVDEMKNAKVEFEVYKEVMRIEKENFEKVDEEEKEEIRAKYDSEIDWSSFEDGSFKYNVEYDESSQSIWFESDTENEYEMYGTYDLKYETLTIYNVEFNKTSDE